MYSRPLPLMPALAALTCAILTSCAAAATPGAGHRPPSSVPRPSASSPQATGRAGSPAHPLLLSCAQEAYPKPPNPSIPPHPQPADLVIGPLFIPGGKLLAAKGGSSTSYKIPFVLLPRSKVTVMIAAPARGRVVIDIPGSPAGGVAAVSYHSCPHVTGSFAQSFTFTHGQTHGCVPLDVTIGHRPRVHHFTLSLFAGPCPP